MPGNPPGPEELAQLVCTWRAAPRNRPPRDEIVKPEPGQQSVWDYPRPPRVEAFKGTIKVNFAGAVIAKTTRALRVTETGGAPVYYIPPADVNEDYLAVSDAWSICEWKGLAQYADIAVDGRKAKAAAWRYTDPLDGYREIEKYWAFYPQEMDACFVNGARVTPQPGSYYGGWVTAEILGPFKGGPGSESW